MDKAMEAAARAVDPLAERPMAKPTIEELEKILAEPAGNVEIRPDGRIVVDGKSNSTEIAQAAITAWLAAEDGERIERVARAIGTRLYGTEDYPKDYHSAMQEMARAAQKAMSE